MAKESAEAAAAAEETTQVQSVDLPEVSENGQVNAAGQLDILLDMLTYSGLVFAFAFGRPEHALMAAFLITTFVGTGCSLLTFAVLATKRGIETEQRGRKSFYHAAGLAEGTESILFCCAMCLFPDQFALLAGLFATMCLITTVGRLHMARQLFDGGSPSP